MSNIKIIESGDGSHTLLHEGLNETYHSTKGAVTESEYVFIEKGIDYLISRGQKQMRILEVGFGTGLNALLTAIKAEKDQLKINYTTLEPFPVEKEIIEKLNYTSRIDYPEANALFSAIHSAGWENEVEIIPGFKISKIKQPLLEAELPDGIDLVFYDAFAPSRQAEIWEEDNFKKIRPHLSENAVLVSYCSSGNFRRALKATGFFVEKLPGPPGKREMVRGVFGRV